MIASYNNEKFTIQRKQHRAGRKTKITFANLEYICNRQKNPNIKTKIN